MRQAFTLMGVLTLLVTIGAFVAFHEKAEAPVEIINTNHTTMAFTLTSPAFENGGMIPRKFTCDEENINPELHIGGVPAGTKSFVLIMDDPDVPKERRPEGYFDHWVVYGMSPETTVIKEGEVLSTGGLNGRGAPGYVGPCPPTEFQPTEHRYFFRLYATDIEVFPTYATTPGKLEILKEIEGHTLGVAELMGRYDRAPKE